MGDEDFDTEGRTQIYVGEDISMLSIEELGKRIKLFEQEISRIRADILEKKESKEAAESFFRS